MKTKKLAKFTVGVKEVWEHTLTVELPANATKEQILEAANQLIAEGDEGTTEYSHTLDTDQWTVRDKDGNYK
jgi:hypothetical protein